FYAAPEAMQGLYHQETDYYAFGITIFELFTGFTPFQNAGLTQEEAARLASINKIKFPENVPQSLRELVIGLTYKDLSHRNEPDNPNRRWGYEEVCRWLKGEKLQLPGESGTVTASVPVMPSLSYVFKGKKFTSTTELCNAMLKDPTGGLKDLGRGLLTHHFAQIDEKLSALCYEAESRLENCEDGKKVLKELLYRLSPELLNAIYIGGYKYSSIAQLADDLQTPSLMQKEDYIQAVFNALDDGTIGSFAAIQPSGKALTSLLHALSEKIKLNKFDSRSVVILLSWCLKGQGSVIIIGNQIYADLGQLGAVLIESAITQPANNELIRAIRTYFNSGLLQEYSEIILQDSALKNQINHLQSKFAEKNTSEIEFALEVGYSISSCRKIRMDSEIYSSVKVFYAQMQSLRQRDFVAYAEKIEPLKSTMSLYIKVLPQPDSDLLKELRDGSVITVLGDNEYRFYSRDDFKHFADELIAQKKPQELCGIMSRYGEALEEISQKVWHNQAYDNVLEKINRFIYLDELVFCTPDDFRAYVKNVLEHDSRDGVTAEQFICSHHDALEQLRERSDCSDIVKELELGSSAVRLDEMCFENAEAFEEFINQLCVQNMKCPGLAASYHRRHSDTLAKLSKTVEIKQILERLEQGINLEKTTGNALINGVKYPTFQIPKVGEYFTFGSYWQENEKTKTPVEWLVLAKNEKQALVISRYALDCRPYHGWSGEITWEECDLRKWLNSEFIYNVFSKEEQQRIATTMVENKDNPKYGTSGGNDTHDKLFCLNIEEVQKYFKDKVARKCQPTSYAVSRKAWKSDNRCCDWWFRSSGNNQKSAAVVRDNGSINLYGYNVSNDNNAIRVAFWINLYSEIF
ncbi:MAG: DUF6273 domain-containing protein, partial [Succinivibrionaceae bacterium]|nr:DUF6273 domain-containing protein [Succinivibrionaceae bacterium]